MSAGALLAESVRTAISGLRALASALEEALLRFDNSRHGSSGDVENQADSQPSLGLPGDSVTTTWDFVSTASVAQSAPVPAVLPQAIGHLLSQPAALLGQTFPLNPIIVLLLPWIPLPGYCIDLCVRLGGTKEEVEFRARRAWEAGLWAKATLDGVVPKPRPTPKFHLRPTIYIIIRAPSVVRPVRVDSAAEYFRLIPSFSGSSSISHSFASVAEARVYCAGVGIALPDSQWPPWTLWMDVGFRSELVVHPVMAPCHNSEPFGGLRDPHLHSGKRSSHGSPPGFDPSGDFDFGAECSIGRPCRPFDCDQVPCCSGSQTMERKCRLEQRSAVCLWTLRRRFFHWWGSTIQLRIRAPRSCIFGQSCRRLCHRRSPFRSKL